MFTYFMSRQDGAIKIGRSRRPWIRMRAICVKNKSVKMLGALDGDSERELHGRFESIRIKGEWFKADKSLVEFIANNASIPPPDDGPRILSVGIRPEHYELLRKISDARGWSVVNTIGWLITRAAKK